MAKLTGHELDTAIGSSEVLVLDVRSPDEVAEHGTPPGALNVPIGELEERIEEVRTAAGSRQVLTA